MGSPATAKPARARITATARRASSRAWRRPDRSSPPPIPPAGAG
jgi:hypothetical protein